MTDYLEYNKGGYVLIAPSVNYKHQYILKCFMCDEYYGEFEPFLTHALSHNAGKFSNPSGDLDDVYQDEAKVQIHAYEIDDSDDQDAVHEIYEVEVQGINSVKNEEIKEEDTLEDSAYYRHIEIEQEHNASIGQNSLYEDDTILSNQDDKSDDEESIADSKDSLYEPKSEAEDSDFQEVYLEDASYEGLENSTESKKSRTKKSSLNTEKEEDIDDNNEDLGNTETEVEKLSAESKSRSVSVCVQNFLRSDRNAKTIIEAYRRQHLLWNLNYMEYLRTKERRKCVQKIAQVIKQELNIHLTCNEVSGIIIYLRLKYKAYLLRGLVGIHQSEKILKRLDFLRPFMENNYIAVLSEDRPYLSIQQIVEILRIYKNFPVLWNTNMIEHWCNNKQKEARERMVKILNLKMNLTINGTVLGKYLYGVHAFLTKLKYHNHGKGRKKEEPHPVYYDNMLFLYKYVSPFECSICHKFLRTPLYLTEHMMEHDESIRFQCTLCEKDFKIPEHFVDHVRRHMGDLDIECKVCDKKFLKKTDLKSHMRTHTGEKSYTCDICGITYRYVSSLVIHKRKHNKEYIFHCQLCPKKFTSKTGLNTHMLTHKTERDCVCKICGKAFKTKGTLRHHEWTHEEGSHPCEVCGKIFRHKYRVYEHMKTHRSKKK